MVADFFLPNYAWTLVMVVCILLLFLTGIVFSVVLDRGCFGFLRDWAEFLPMTLRRPNPFQIVQIWSALTAQAPAHSGDLSWHLSMVFQAKDHDWQYPKFVMKTYNSGPQDVLYFSCTDIGHTWYLHASYSSVPLISQPSGPLMRIFLEK